MGRRGSPGRTDASNRNPKRGDVAVSTGRTLGACPHCETGIPATGLLIEYETEAGRDLFAECPECEVVVTPE